MKYKKVNQSDVYDVLANVALNIMSPIDVINISNIASLLKTSKYQAKKYVDILVKDNMAELKCESIYDEDDVLPPYWGYRLTEKGKDTEQFKAKEKRHLEIIEECFGS